MNKHAMPPFPRITGRVLRRGAPLTAAFALSLAATGAMQARAQAPSAWQVAGVQGIVQIVIAPNAQARDAAAYQALIAKLCQPERSCFINFYENPTGAPVTMPLPEAIAAQPTATFRRSMKNGAELLQWSCRLAMNTGDAPCF